MFSFCSLVPEKLEVLPLPLANDRRPCVLVGRDNMALPASLISQIGYRCHPSLYTEGDPGEKVELVAGILCHGNGIMSGRRREACRQRQYI